MGHGKRLEFMTAASVTPMARRDLERRGEVKTRSRHSPVPAAKQLHRALLHTLYVQYMLVECWVFQQSLY